MSEPPDNWDDEPIDRQALMLMAAALEGGMGVVAVFFGWAAGVPFWHTISGGLWAAGIGVALSLPMIIGVIGLSELSWKPLEQIRGDLARVVHWLSQCSVTDLLAISLLAGVGEEALFRGFLQSYLEGFTGPIGAIAISSIAFGLMHAISASYTFFAVVISVYLGIVYAWTDNLLIVIAIHTAYDFAALLYGIKIRPIEE